MAREKQRLGLDFRGVTEVDPNVELKDYSGPFKSDLRFSDFSREQGARMYALAHHYHYITIHTYSGYILDRWGKDAYLEAQKFLWVQSMPELSHGWITDGLSFDGNDLEAFMKSLQVNLTLQPGPFFDTIIEMPSKDHGIITINVDPIVKECEESGRANELFDMFTTVFLPALKNFAKCYHADIVINALIMPPRESKNSVCAKFDVHYKVKSSVGKQDAELLIDQSKKDTRGITDVDPKVELKDYSGPFKPDLRITDFSREQLAKMYLMAHLYDAKTSMLYNEWVREHYGVQALGEMNTWVWGHHGPSLLKGITEEKLKTPGNDIESFLKAWQVDFTSLPPTFDMYFELHSKDHATITFNRCIGTVWAEELGEAEEFAEKFCSMEPPCIGNSARLYDPEMKVKILAFPPRDGSDEVCCKWELYYDNDAPRVTRFDGRVWTDEDLAPSC